MRAILSTAPGGPDSLVLGELPEPTPAAGEVVIAVKACGVNYPDVLIIQDLYQVKPQRPFAPGGEIAGTIAAVGADVTSLRVGQRVMAYAPFGGMTEKIAVPATACTPLPDEMPFEEAAGFALTYGTAFYALKDRGRLQKGETLLILGASGGVGIPAVELGKALGARVIAAASSQEKVDIAKKHGADVGIVYPTDVADTAAQKSLATLFKDACGPNGADVIYDPVGGAYAEPAVRTAAWGGRFLVIGFPAGVPKIPLNLTLLKSCEIVGVFFGAWARRDPAHYQANSRALMDLYRKGAIKPHISARYPLAKAGEAIDLLAKRKVQGKVIVTMD